MEYYEQYFDRNAAARNRGRMETQRVNLQYMRQFANDIWNGAIAIETLFHDNPFYPRRIESLQLMRDVARRMQGLLQDMSLAVERTIAYGEENPFVEVMGEGDRTGAEEGGERGNPQGVDTGREE